MLDPATGNALVFNGEIYNFQALRATLQQKGHVFVSQTDTEVILKGYAEWGGACLADWRECMLWPFTMP